MDKIHENYLLRLRKGVPFIYEHIYEHVLVVFLFVDLLQFNESFYTK